MKNSSFNSLQVKTKCENKLKIKFRKSGELNGWFEHNGKKIARITIPQGRKFIPPKTYTSMASQLKISVDDFDLLLECPLKYEEYIKKLELKKLI